MKEHIKAIENWNEFKKNYKLELFAHPNSKQVILSNAANLATEYFDSLPEIDGLLVDNKNGLKYRYNYDGTYECYELTF